MLYFTILLALFAGIGDPFLALTVKKPKENQCFWLRTWSGATRAGSGGTRAGSGATRAGSGGGPGPCFGMNGHPRGATDVILRLS